jgi:uncharacterized protein YjiS (DUF1127 family)
MGDIRVLALPPCRPVLRGLAGVYDRLAATWIVWRERANQRWRLAQLDDHMLRDIGVSRAAAEKEASKPFWRP